MSEEPTMEYRNLGRAGVQVSPLCLGTMMFGSWGNPDHDDAVRTIHRAIDAGINFIDTANVYSAGESEEIVAKAIRDRREDVVLATKVWGAMGEGPNRRGLSRKAIQEQCEASLRRLGTDVIDLYQIHRPDPTTPWDETLRALDDLVRQGKVRYLGCSTNHYEDPGNVWGRRLAAWEMVETLWTSDRLGLERFVSLQPPYSLLRRVMELEHFPAVRRHGIGTMVWSPLESGWLAGKYRRGKPMHDSPRAQRWVVDIEDPKFAPRLEVVEALIPLAEARGISMAHLALAWLLRNPDVTSVVIGPRTMEQLEDCIAALDVSLDDELLAKIDELVPPGTSAL